ncbi:NlpC/P60 family protein [Streptomyces roseicoloratus]|uniref:NlpC/P60 family protein n=1 Tax=Streptomyces roseicoloratus TaxID=2508722 RepID=A0ABY9RVS0_9ACTN|nr:NlpC/P60 family protein [Streptomyces roseicoloratus]WMX46270.1 NlpC/P60 family protein [Streptomyces roseicoloratus]
MSAPKFRPSRRSALLALAGATAGGALPPVAAPAAAAADTPAALPWAEPSAPTVPGARMPMLIDPTDPWHFTPRPAGALATRAIAGGLEVSDGGGVLATLTTGARTVTVRGPRRWFTEQKRRVEDSFSRELTGGTTGWGTSPDGGTWWPNSKDDAHVADYKVTAGRAAVTLSATGSSRHAYLSDKGLGDVRARARFSFTQVPVGAPLSLALTFSLKSLDTHYRARLVVTPAREVQLVLEKALDNVVTVLGAPVTVGTGFAAYDHWWVQAEKTGDVLRVRAWKHGVAESALPAWTHSLRDPDGTTALGAGAVGVRAYANSGAQTGVEARVYDFLVEEASWTDPPVVTHDTWVRVLPEPFDGTWTPELEQRVRAWAGDLSPDALAHAAMFLPYASSVTDPARGGAKVLGPSLYSRPDPVTGLRTVGADFQEYAGISWTFPGFPARAPEAEFLGCLDCSGFVRMVYGYHMGIPLLHESAAPDGHGLPRTSAQQSAAGPGVKIADGGTGTVPPLTGLRIGDTVFFDTDEDSDAGGHIGIYLGPDQYGKRRFVSSRKTPNGPTMADVGGKSILDGTPASETAKGDLYTNTLRVIRRF